VSGGGLRPEATMATQRRHGLDRIEIILFVFGVFAFAFLMLVLGDLQYVLPLIGLWIVAGLAFIWWLDRRMARSAQGDIARLEDHRRRRRDKQSTQSGS
jgi:uncharacterized membrane protein